MSIPRDSHRRHPRPRHHQDQRGLRLRRPEAAGADASSRTPASGSTTTSRSGSAASSSIVDAVGGIEICPKTDMKDKLANLDIKKGCQEADGTTALGYARSRHTSSIGDIDRAAAPARGGLGGRPRGASRRGRSSTRCATGGSTWRRPTSSPSARAPGPVRGRAVGVGDDPRERRQRPDLRRADRRPRRELGPEQRSKQMFDTSSRTTTDDIPKSLCTPTGLPKSVTGRHLA